MAWFEPLSKILVDLMFDCFWFEEGFCNKLPAFRECVGAGYFDAVSFPVQNVVEHLSEVGGVHVVASFNGSLYGFRLLCLSCMLAENEDMVVPVAKHCPYCDKG